MSYLSRKLKAPQACDLLGVQAPAFRMWRHRYAEFFEWSEGHRGYYAMDLCLIAVAVALIDMGVTHEEAFRLTSRKNENREAEKLFALLAHLCSGGSIKRNVVAVIIKGGYAELEGAGLRHFAAGPFLIYDDEPETERHAWEAKDVIGRGRIHTFMKLDIGAVAEITLARLKDWPE